MGRFSGKIGYGETGEFPEGSGIYEYRIGEKPYFGDIEWSNRRYDHSGKVIDDISVNNSISVVADSYANQHFMNIRYVLWQGVRWTVQSVEVKHPRLILYIGTVYNGPTP